MGVANIRQNRCIGSAAVGSPERPPSFLTLCQVAGNCKGVAVVANKLKLGLRRPRGRHPRVEHRIQAAIGDISVQWMRSHLTAQQAEAAELPAAYVAGNAEADLLAGRAVQAVYLPCPLSLAFLEELPQRLAPFGVSLPRLAPLNTCHRRTKSQGRHKFAVARATFYSQVSGEGEPSNPQEQRLLPEGGTAGQEVASIPDLDGMEPSGAEGSGSHPDVRVDDSMDRRVPVAAEDPE
eukprot:603314-Amphidinium_carterae.1